jgi:putative DNA primase/helicase
MTTPQTSTTGTASSNSSQPAGAQSQSRVNQPSGGAQGLPQVTFPPLARRPCFIVYDTPFINAANNHRYDAGVYHHFTEEKKDSQGNVTDVPRNQWILSVLRVFHVLRTDDGKEHSYLIGYLPHGETDWRYDVLPQANLLGRAEEALKFLRGLGVSVLRENIGKVCEYLDTQHQRFSADTPSNFWISTQTIGWAPLPTRFILPNEIIGEQEGVWFVGKGNAAKYSKGGTFPLWQSLIAAPCVDNSYLIMALSTSFAGPLLEPLNIPGLGFHLFGESTTGKTTTLIIGGSVWSSPKFMRTWRATLNGLEIQAASRSSTLLTVDESNEVEGKVLDSSVYMLLHGTTKDRMRRDTSGRENLYWRVCILSSGEHSIEAHQATAKIDHKVGQTVRMIDIPVASGTHGLFENLHRYTSGAKFSDALRAAAAMHYGYAGPLFVEKLIKEYPKLDLHKRLADTLTKFGYDLNAQDERVARSFALSALAGELATEFGVLPWASGSAVTAAVAIFNHWRRTQPKS